MPWASIINNEYGVLHGFHDSFEKAFSEVEAYVDTWWFQEMATEKPDDRKDKVERYFAACHNENYDIVPVEAPSRPRVRYATRARVRNR